MTINVDTLKLAIQLEAGGFTGEQARALATALGEAAQVANLVTNADLKAALKDLEQRMTIRLGTMLVVMTGVLGAIVHYAR
jgi:hypothetical protein